MTLIVTQIISLIALILTLLALCYCLYIGYIQYGWFKKLFHDKLNMHAPISRKNEEVGTISICRYCNKRIINGECFWKEDK